MIGIFLSVLLFLAGMYSLAHNELIIFLTCQGCALAWYIAGYFHHKFESQFSLYKGIKEDKVNEVRHNS